MKQQKQKSQLKTIKFHALVTVLVGPLMLADCATVPQVVPVTDHTKRVVFKGASVLPPQGSDWYLLDPDGSDAPGGIFARRVDPSMPLGITQPQPHVARAMVLVTEPSDLKPFDSSQQFLEFIKKANTKPRYRVLDETYTVDNRAGTYCVRLDRLAEDLQPPYFPGSIFIWDQSALYCVHPQNKKMLVLARCGQIAPSREDLIDMDTECEHFIQSLEFTKL